MIHLDPTFQDLADAADSAGWQLELDAIAGELEGGTGNAAYRLFARNRANGQVLASTEWAAGIHEIAVSLACKLISHAERAVRDVVASVRMTP